MRRYRQAFAVPWVPTTMALTFLSRLPLTAMTVALILHVVDHLKLGYAAAGLVVGTLAVGNAIGAPTVGRIIDRRGVRTAIVLCGTLSSAYWLLAPHVPYLVLLLAVIPVGLFSMPAGSISRQTLTALVPHEQRRTAYAMDGIATEITFMAGPSAAILLATQFSSTTALTAVGICFTVVTLALYVRNPPMRSYSEQADTELADRPPMREWLGRRFIATLVVATGTLLCLTGNHVAVLATTKQNGEVAWTGLVIISMCLASIAGGLVYGALHRSLPQRRLMLIVALGTLLAAFAGDTWWMLALALALPNFATAPTLASTTETTIKLAPPQVRGTAMGLQDSAIRTGLAVGSPLVGFVIDHTSPAWGFVASGIGALTCAAIAFVITAWPPVRQPAFAQSVD